MRVHAGGKCDDFLHHRGQSRLHRRLNEGHSQWVNTPHNMSVVVLPSVATFGGSHCLRTRVVPPRALVSTTRSVLSWSRRASSFVRLGLGVFCLAGFFESSPDSGVAAVAA